LVCTTRLSPSVNSAVSIGSVSERKVSMWRVSAHCTAALGLYHGVRPSDVIWVRGGIEEPGRPEKNPIKLPLDIHLEDAPEGETISDLLDRGDIDGFIAPRPPSCAATNPHVGWLFPDPIAAAKDYYARTRIFPIMYLVGVRRRLALEQPWLRAAVLKAFEQAKAESLRRLADTSAPKVTCHSWRSGSRRRRT
jgi:4,5-dihydroxyphthalate decarboxylase